MAPLYDASHSVWFRPARGFVAAVAAVVLLASVLGAARPAVAASSDEPNPCTLMSPASSPSAPLAKRGPLRSLLQSLRKGRYRQACKTAEGLRQKVSGKVKRLFHAEASDSANNRAIQKFLDEWVYGKDAVLRIAEDDFRFVPAYYAAEARCACELGDTRRARDAVAALTEAKDPRSDVYEAATWLRAGESLRALAIVGKPKPEERVRKTALRGLAQWSAGDSQAAKQSFSEALERCVGPASCDPIQTIRERALAAERTP